jgi:hypothetical protein
MLRSRYITIELNRNIYDVNKNHHFKDVLFTLNSLFSSSLSTMCIILSSIFCPNICANVSFNELDGVNVNNGCVGG